jgi:prevent-host-death family protein
VDTRFWARLDDLAAAHPAAIDRPQRAPGPDYGSLEGTRGGDGDGVDVWLGSRVYPLADQDLPVPRRRTHEPAKMAIYLAIWRCLVPKQYSIAEARDHLASIVHDVEQGEPVELTRRGKPVAVVLSLDDYGRTTGRTVSFPEAWESFRQTTDLDGFAFSDEELAQLRDRSPGRDFRWE